MAELAARLFRTTYAEQIPRCDMEAHIAAAFTAETQAAEIGAPGGTVMVAAEGPRLAAYAQLLTAPPPLARADPEAMHIARFYLDSPLQGTGFAGTLMGACLDWALRQGGVRRRGPDQLPGGQQPVPGPGDDPDAGLSRGTFWFSLAPLNVSQATVRLLGHGSFQTLQPTFPPGIANVLF
jgi:GNAT superfamily N-acetyltransferase